MSVAAASPGFLQNTARIMRRHPGLMFGLFVVGAMVVLAVAAPWLHTVDPTHIRPRMRLKPPSGEFWFGTDATGRDLWSRIAFGSRVSLIVGASVASISLVIGLAIGMVAGVLRKLDGIIMRIMDGVMAIPAILLAIMVVSLFGTNLQTVIIAITLPEIPRVVRLTRSVVLTVRGEAYVEAAVSMGTPTLMLMIRHILPNILAPVIVQATFTASAAILIEASLSFLGIGTPSEIPSWGNIMADGRNYFQAAPQLIILPGLLVALTVLAVNCLGDGLRDLLDPRFAKSIGDAR
ncbi:ABC transporter permease [Bradyrhizobium sp. Cp5.3]|uniref:ABC transporter permease n=1 Tax=Bradyrhizobium sp. Cp5.3 TaxID=443598 RepID=UPI000484807A|nr:ABC transporter permease [Bradyrhizobium sp. Cp5.3]